MRQGKTDLVLFSHANVLCHIHMYLFSLFLHRGLDVHPKTLCRFASQGDTSSVKVLEVIYADEITHVAAGLRWFTYICSHEGWVRTAQISYFNHVTVQFKWLVKFACK